MSEEKQIEPQPPKYTYFIEGFNPRLTLEQKRDLAEKLSLKRPEKMKPATNGGIVIKTHAALPMRPNYVDATELFVIPSEELRNDDPLPAELIFFHSGNLTIHDIWKGEILGAYRHRKWPPSKDGTHNNGYSVYFYNKALAGLALHRRSPVVKEKFIELKPVRPKELKNASQEEKDAFDTNARRDYKNFFIHYEDQELTYFEQILKFKQANTPLEEPTPLAKSPDDLLRKISSLESRTEELEAKLSSHVHDTNRRLDYHDTQLDTLHEASSILTSSLAATNKTVEAVGEDLKRLETLLQSRMPNKEAAHYPQPTKTNKSRKKKKVKKSRAQTHARNLHEEKKEPEKFQLLLKTPNCGTVVIDLERYPQVSTSERLKRLIDTQWTEIPPGQLSVHGIPLRPETKLRTLPRNTVIEYLPSMPGGMRKSQAQTTLKDFFPIFVQNPNDELNLEEKESPTSNQPLVQITTQSIASTGENSHQEEKEAMRNPNQRSTTTQISIEESLLGKPRRTPNKPSKEVKKWSLNILQWNAYHLVIDGDLPGFNHKVTELLSIVEKHEIDVVLIEELKAKGSKHPAPILPGFHPPIVLDTGGTKAIATYVRRHLFYESIPANEDLPESVAVLSTRIFLKDKKSIRIDNIYFHPSAPKDHRIRAWHWTTKSDEDYHILAGDFNERCLVLGNEDGDANPSFNCLLEDNYGVLNDGSPTRAQKNGTTFAFSAIDGTIASASLAPRIHGWETLEALDSDHFPIVTKLRMSPKTKPRPKLKRIRYGQLHAEFLKYFEDAPGNAGQKFIAAIQQLEVLRFTRMPVRYKCTFWNTDLELLKRKRNRARNRGKVNKYTKLRSKFRQAFKKAKTNDYLHRLKQAASLPNPWKTMKLLVPSLRKRRSKITTTPSDTQDIVDSLAVQYAELMTTELEERKEREDHEPVRKITIHPWEIQTVLRSSNHSSSPGHDGLTYRHIFKLCENLAILSALTAAVNQWVQHGIPDSFKIAKIIPIPKPGKNAGFRPISLLSCLSKVVERIMTIRMRRRYDHLIPENQAGCRSGSAAPDCIIRFFHASTRAHSKMIHNRRGHFAALFIDFSKAYDRVEPEILLQKLKEMGISKTYRYFIKDWLTDRRIQVHMNDCSSQVMNISRGLPQGSSLSVLLWQLYIADIPLSMQESAQYMDDCCAWRTADTKRELATHLQSDLDKIKTWAEKSMILLNTKKTCILMNEYDPEFKLNFHDAKILPVRNTRYLGFDLLSFQEPNSQIMIDNSKVADAIKKRTHLLYHLKNKVAPSVLNQVGQALIMGKLQYYAPAWGAENQSFIRPLQVAVNRFLRIICTGRRTTPIPLLISRTGILPVELIIKKSAARTYGRMTEYPERSLYKTYSEWNGTNSNSTPLGALYDFGYLMKNKYHQHSSSRSGRISFQQMQSLTKICFDIPDTISQALKCQRISEGNPTEEIQIWSDGSLAESCGEKSAGAGWIIVAGDQFIMNHRRVEPATSSFLSELAAMTLGLEELIETLGEEVSTKSVGIFSDSQSLCKHLEKIATHDGIIQSSMRNLINKLTSLILLNPCKVTIHWIPGHQGFRFNELADMEANHGRQCNHIYRMKIPRSLLKKEADKFIDEKFRTYLRENIQESKWNKDYPRREHFIKNPGRQMPKNIHEIRLFNLQTGHTGLRTHHRRIANDDFDDVCRLCGLHPETIQHIFAECCELPELNFERQRLAEEFGDESITQIVGENVEEANKLLISMIRKLVARKIWI